MLKKVFLVVILREAKNLLLCPAVENKRRFFSLPKFGRFQNDRRRDFSTDC
jgi:hypothetical protein